MQPVTFEDLRRSSHDEVRQLILRGLGERWGSIDESLNPDLDDMFASYASGRTIVARDRAGSIVGTGTLLPRDTSTAEIVRMSVAQATRGKGIGRQIVAELVATARRWHCTSVRLETTSTWTDAVAFYLSCGFEITHEVHDEFGPSTHFKLDLGTPAI